MLTNFQFISYYNIGCKHLGGENLKNQKMKKIITSLIFCAALMIGTSADAFACGTSFGANIEAGTGGYGVVNGNKNNKYYHLTPGRAGLEVTSVSGGKFSVYLYKGWREIDKCVNITSPTWRRFYDIPSDSYDYWLKIVVEGNSHHSYRISGRLHDHGDPR